MQTYIIIGLIGAVIILTVLMLVKKASSGNENAISELKAELTGKISEIEKNLNAEMSGILLTSSNQNQLLTKTVTETVNRMADMNEKKLEEIRLTVDEKLSQTLTARIGLSFKTVSDRLESVYKSLGEMKEISSSVSGDINLLSRMLSNVKVRGTFAEVQLASILDQTIPGMYEKNFAPDEKCANRVEFAVRIPDHQGNIAYLPVDSKFPLESYLRLCNAAQENDANAVRLNRQNLLQTIVNEAKAVSKYINPPVTTQFAVMYLATEGLYSEVISSAGELVQSIQTKYNVILAGPSTITALLNSIQMGYRTIAINEKAKEISQLLAVAKSQYELFAVSLAKAKKKIEEAGSSIEEAGKRNDIIRKKLKNADETDSFIANTFLNGENDNE
ncbi:MAG: DNA recombination protein RmuC [Clostridiales bacterium]|nr:DNA recombination protein RmuC [Clostridiales bacterium]